MEARLGQAVSNRAIATSIEQIIYGRKTQSGNRLVCANHSQHTLLMCGRVKATLWLSRDPHNYLNLLVDTAPLSLYSPSCNDV